MDKRKWLRMAQPCKIGTIPMLVRVDARMGTRPGRYTKIQYHPNGPWETVFVTRHDPDGYFMADK